MPMKDRRVSSNEDQRIEATWVAVGANDWIVAGDGDRFGDRSTQKSAKFVREEEAIGYDEWMPNGLKNGSACVADAD